MRIKNVGVKTSNTPNIQPFMALPVIMKNNLDDNRWLRLPNDTSIASAAHLSQNIRSALQLFLLISRRRGLSDWDIVT